MPKRREEERVDRKNRKRMEEYKESITLALVVTENQKALKSDLLFLRNLFVILYQE